MNVRSKISLALALLTAPLAVLAQDFPSKPVRLIVPLSAGSLTDTMVRTMVAKMSATLGGATVVIENQPGAGAIVGIASAARAAPDGYTWAIGSSASFSGNPHLHKQLSYNPVKDFAPVCRMGGAPQILAVNPSLGAKTLPDLLTKAKSESLSFASSGVGTTTHMAQEMFKSRVNGKFIHVPYKGTAQAVNDTVGGHAQLLFESPGPLLGFIREGKLVALGSTGARRIPALQNVPTFEELGYKGLRLDGWIGVVVPARTPAPIVNKIAEACKAALATPEMQALAQSQGFDIDYAGPPEFGTFIASELQKWGELFRLAGVKPE